MNNLMKVAVTVVAVAFGAPVLAATAAPVDMKTCETLMHEFDAGVATSKAAAARITAARTLRASAEKECKAGNYAKGVADLHTAKADIGLTTSVN